MKNIKMALCAAALLGLHGAAQGQAQSWLAEDSKKLSGIESSSGNDTARLHAEGLPSLTFSQAQYSESWKDGSSSLGFRAAFLGSATYTKRRLFFKSSLDVAYAKSKEGEATKFVKKEDRLGFSNALGYKISPGSPLYWAAQVDIKTQLDKGYNAEGTSISQLFAPAYIIASLGARYQSALGLSAVLSPISGRFTVVSDTAYCKYIDTELAADPRHLRAQLGAYAQLAFERSFGKHVSVKSTLELFSNYQHKPANVDADWTTSASFNLNKWLTIVFFNRMVYRDLDRYQVMGTDADGGEVMVTKGPRVQWTESLNVGLTYKFATK